MYFFAGGLTIICGVLIYFVLPSDPIRAKGFNDRERFIAVSRMRTNNSGVRNTHFKGGQAIELLTDIKFWLIFFYALCGMFANAPISTFQAIIIDGFGFNPLNSLLLMIPSGVYAGTMMLITTYLAYKFPGWRAYIVIMCQLVTMAAALMLWLLPRSELGGLLFACYILTTTGAGYAVVMGLFLANNAGYTKRSLASSGLYIGYSLGRLSSTNAKVLSLISNRKFRRTPGLPTRRFTSLQSGIHRGGYHSGYCGFLGSGIPNPLFNGEPPPRQDRDRGRL